jgi:iron only hydrogenase large subunit-like protein/nitrogen-specific signal transduction histidine kinase
MSTLPEKKHLVYTIKEKCRVCYTCVRECPAKAIKIINGQAEVLSDRCIACGNCIKVCSQYAKVFQKEISQVNALLKSGERVVAMVAPSFPAEFLEIDDYRYVVGMIRALGFEKVTEVAFGADLVAAHYKKRLLDANAQPLISSDCPAIVKYIEHYHPDLIPKLAPIVSPMIAMSKVVYKEYGEDVKIVFIGPCIAKKAECDTIENVLTFRELKEIFAISQITPQNVEPSEFDPPLGGKGAIFPVNRGLLRTIDIEEDILDGNIIVAEGRVNFQEAIREFEGGLVTQEHLELLCCDGCIMGPGMSPYPFFSGNSQRFTKKSNVRKYVLNKLKNLNTAEWEYNLKKFASLDLSQTFTNRDMRINRPSPEKIQEILQKMGKFQPQDLLDCGVCGYDSCEEHAIAIIKGLAENEMCLPYAIEKLHKSVKELNISNEKLASTQQALRQSEKLASLGQLSAGIAHELNNPLGVITMYSNILKDESPAEDPKRQDLDLIVEQADRCKKIVSGLLNFARKNQVNFEELDVNKLIEHSINSVVVPSNIEVSLNSEVKNPLAMLDRDQMTQVFTNLIKNAVEAIASGGRISIEIHDNDNEIIFSVKDTGTGIAPENMNKLFTPFFTTKGIGKGTGLGLPIIYGIVKMHKGQLNVISNDNPKKGATGTTFKITVPRSRPN